MPSVPFGKEMKLPNSLGEMATPRLGEPLGYEGSDSAADKRTAVRSTQYSEDSVGKTACRLLTFSYSLGPRLRGRPGATKKQQPARLNGLATGRYLLAGLPWLSLVPEPVDTRARLKTPTLGLKG
ncbi:hypothetical protein F5144DRAFT_564229 [Chaetomium tenue]|uniref:Uncharacterized protein n=1 Tax=Chaetomium tenue TaxID=1854479 RepID=A0ACB7PPD5_9PEZI|nr:hypothetical protein F5144DRAFT_564229 [Chaetomium globosum]